MSACYAIPAPWAGYVRLFALLVLQHSVNLVSSSITPPAPGEAVRPAPGLLPLVELLLDWVALQRSLRRPIFSTWVSGSVSFPRQTCSVVRAEYALTHQAGTTSGTAICFTTPRVSTYVYSSASLRAGRGSAAFPPMGWARFPSVIQSTEQAFRNSSVTLPS
jgi:hypothetical protein